MRLDRMGKAGLCLLLLAALCACHREVPPAPTPSPIPTVQTAAPTPSPDPTPTPTAEPTPEPWTPPPRDEPAGADPEALYRSIFAEGKYRHYSFSNAELYDLDREMWFLPLADGLTQVAVDQWHNAYYYHDDTGTRTAEEVSQLLAARAAAAGEEFCPVSPRTWEELWQDVARELTALSREYAWSGAELERRIQSYYSYPALREDMWLCGYPADSDGDSPWYVLLKNGDDYLLLYDKCLPAFLETPEMGRPEVTVRLDFEKAREAYHWFGGMTMPYDFDDCRTMDDPPWSWFRVDYPGISNFEELRLYLETLFTPEIAEDLIGNTGLYREFDGVLYSTPLDGGYTWLTDRTGQTLWESGTRLIYRVEGYPTWQGEPDWDHPVTIDFPYEKVGERWVFTAFPWPD